MIVSLYLLFIFSRDRFLYIFTKLIQNKKYKIEHSSTDTAVIHQTNSDDEEPSSVLPVIIKSSVAKDNLYYNMSFKHRPHCVIFNHSKFDLGLGDDRKGTEVDVAAIKKTFTGLGFNVVVHEDSIFSKINDEIYNLTQEDYTDHSCICIFVLTHGDANGNIRARNLSYPLTYIWKPFTADRCQTLGGKPKLFFIQACRGTEYDPGVTVLPCSQTETDSSSTSYKLPAHADFLIGYSTVDDHVSWRSSTKGSWYIQTLCDVIDKHRTTNDLVKMLTITSRIVATSHVSSHDNPWISNMVQMPSYTSTLTRDIYFKPTS